MTIKKISSIDIECIEENEELIDFLETLGNPIDIDALPDKIREKFFKAVMEDAEISEAREVIRSIDMVTKLLKTISEEGLVHNGLKHAPELILPLSNLNDQCELFTSIFKEELMSDICVKNKTEH